MDIVTLGAALNGSAEYVNSHFKGGSNIQIVDNPDGTQTINASGEVSAEDTVAREAIVEHVLDKANPHEVTATQLGLGNVDNTSDIDKPVSTAMQTALNAKANTADVYSKNEVDSALSGKVDKVSGKGLSTNDYTTAEKNKLAGIEAQANKTVIDSSLSSSSTNPVQNKIVKSALDGKQDALSAEQLAAVNSGITEDDVEQIETNKNNILFNARNGVANVLVNTAVTTTAANGLTYTMNADKSVTVTGNSTAYNAFTVAGSRTYSNAMPLKRGTYIIKAGIAYDSSKPIYVQFGVMTSSGASIAWQNIYDTNKELVVDNDTTRIVYELYNPSGSYSGYNATFYPMIIDKSLYEAGFTEYQPYAKSNVELTQQTNELTKGLVLIAHNSAQGNSGGLTYTPKAADFEIGNGANDRNSGSYLLYCVNWSTTGQPYIALITFSGGQIASLTKTVIVNGFEPTVDLTGGIITVSTCARASLYALR